MKFVLTSVGQIRNFTEPNGNRCKRFIACFNFNGVTGLYKSWIRVKNVFRMIKFNQKAWLKRHSDMNTKLRADAKLIFKKASLS